VKGGGQWRVLVGHNISTPLQNQISKQYYVGLTSPNSNLSSLGRLAAMLVIFQYLYSVLCNGAFPYSKFNLSSAIPFPTHASRQYPPFIPPCTHPLWKQRWQQRGSGHRQQSSIWHPSRTSRLPSALPSSLHTAMRVAHCPHNATTTPAYFVVHKSCTTQEATGPVTAHCQVPPLAPQHI